MTRLLYKSKIYKASYVDVDAREARVIDSDALFREKVGELPTALPDDDDPVKKYGFDPYGDGDPSLPEEDPSVSALFGEKVPQEGEMLPETLEVMQDGEGDGFEDGFSQGLTVEKVDEATMGVGVDNDAIEKAGAEAEQLLAQANDQAQQIVQQAMAEAERQAGEMLEHARQQGHQEGYNAGIAEAQAVGEQAKRDYEAKAKELEKEYDEKLRMMEPDLVEELTGIYEHVFTVDLSGYRSVINHLITNTMHALESSQTYLIHVSPDDYSALSMQKAQLRKDSNIPDGATMELVEDISLSKNQCLIETDDGIFDCSLTVQLDELKKKLMLLAYEGTRK